MLLIIVLFRAAGWGKQFDIYGTLTTVSIFGAKIVGTSDPAVAELFVKESEYFTKKIRGGLKEIKEFAGGGLFTSDSDADEWKLAHKILMPAFSPRAIKVKFSLFTNEKKYLDR